MKMDISKLLDPTDPVAIALESVNDEQDDSLTRLFEGFDDIAELYNFLVDYRHFNEVFAPSVIRLASDIHFHFIELGLGPNGSEIASGVYKACHHEYHESHNGREWTHSRLSHIFINHMYESMDGSTRSRVRTLMSDDVSSYCARVISGYTDSKNSLGYRLGFHIGSEFMAANEFHTIDKLTKKQFSEFYQ